MADSPFKKTVLAYSGGLDTSVIIRWLVDTYGCEVVAFAADLGQGEELDPLEEKAKSSGASEFHVVDLRDEFIRDFAFPVMRAEAIYERKYLLATSLARPLIAKAQVDIARKTNADSFSHGATGKGNDQVRFELTYKALAPDLGCITPWRDPNWTIKDRDEAMAYAAKHGIPVPSKAGTPYSMDRNMWHISFEGGVLEDPCNAPDKDMFVLTVDPEDAPDKPEIVEIEFAAGNPVKVDGKSMSPVEIVEHLNAVAGRNGVGRADLVENRLVGIKSRGVYESPAATVLYAGHRALCELVLDRETHHARLVQAERYAELVYNGQWYTPLKESLDAFFNTTEPRVTGTVKMKLYKGNLTILARQSAYSLYMQDLGGFGESDIYQQSDATGFINCYGLPMMVEALAKRNWPKS